MRDAKENTELAVERYKTGDVSLNRAAEIVGRSPEEFKELLRERGIDRDIGFLADLRDKDGYRFSDDDRQDLFDRLP